jgi:dihydrofolate reductase
LTGPHGRGHDQGAFVGRVVVTNHLTLDGVMQAPGRPDEDVRGGFEHGGWAMARNDAVMGRVMGERMAQGGALLFGRRTYEHFYGFWPHQKDNPFTEVLDNTQKYVASTTLKEPLPWRNSTLLAGDAMDAVAKLKEQPGKDIVVLGSGELVQSLMRCNLVDEYVLLIHPLVLGSGRRLFPDGSPFAALRLVDSVTTATGVVIATYQPTSSTARRS